MDHKDRSRRMIPKGSLYDNSVNPVKELNDMKKSFDRDRGEITQPTLMGTNPFGFDNQRQRIVDNQRQLIFDINNNTMINPQNRDRRDAFNDTGVITTMPDDGSPNIFKLLKKESTG